MRFLRVCKLFDIAGHLARPPSRKSLFRPPPGQKTRSDPHLRGRRPEKTARTHRGAEKFRGPGFEPGGGHTFPRVAGSSPAGGTFRPKSAKKWPKTQFDSIKWACRAKNRTKRAGKPLDLVMVPSNGGRGRKFWQKVAKSGKKWQKPNLMQSNWPFLTFSGQKVLGNPSIVQWSHQMGGRQVFRAKKWPKTQFDAIKLGCFLGNRSIVHPSN